MSAFLPPALLNLFKPNPPLAFVQPLDAESHERKWPSKMAGVAQYLQEFEDPKDTPAPTFGEKKEVRRARKAKEKELRVKSALEEKKAAWDPNTDPNAEDSDAFKTVFVGRISYNVTAEALEKEFEVYGPIKRCKMVTDKDGKSRGMAFIEYEHESDMHMAFKRGDGKKVDGRRVVVDVERGRTVKNWLPRRLGGGLGATRRGAPNECIKISGRVDSMSSRPPEDDRRSSSYRGGYSDRPRSPPRDRRDDRSRRSSYDDRGRRGGYDRDYDRRDRDRGYDRDRSYDRGYDRDRRR
eukprot:m.140731 g.140731  ORF g.140731 m.140731 type:complete len:295 (-) comp14038_c0_seq4:3777-4661(-)